MHAGILLTLGCGLLVGAQALASLVLAPLREASTPHRDVYAALEPGEFAGTLMLGGFRGLACDLLWLRLSDAKDLGRFYESVALGKTIVLIQPRFEQIWQHLAHDMAYNVAGEVEDQSGKWQWFLAGLDINLRGIERNPNSARLLQHLAWMFHHKGDHFRREITAQHATISARLEHLAAVVRRTVATELPPVPHGPDLSNFRYAEWCYRVAVLVGEEQQTLTGVRPPAFVRRMVAIAGEYDGNYLRNRGAHHAALQRYCASAALWDATLSWSITQEEQLGDEFRAGGHRETCEHNLGRLSRKIELLSERLAGDTAQHQALREALQRRDWARVTQLAAAPGWKNTLSGARIRWRDE